MSDSKTRSIIKAASWRALATLTTTILVYLTTGQVKVAFAVGALEVVSKFALYYLHERLWQRIRLGVE